MPINPLAQCQAVIAAFNNILINRTTTAKAET